MTDFDTDLNALISKHEDGGKGLPEILTSLKRAVQRTRQELLPSQADDEYNAARGLPPMTDAEKRKIAQLEDYEPTPPQRRV